MTFKFVIADGKGKAWKFDAELDSITGKSVGEKIAGKDIKSELEGYELEITGGSDNAGFPLAKSIEGIGLKRQLLTKGFGMQDSYPGIRRRKTLRGRSISNTTVQINLKVLKSGAKKLEEVFPEQNQPKAKAPKPAAAPAA